MRITECETQYLRSIGYKDIEGFPNYLINNVGSVIDVFNGSPRELKHYVNRDGIHFVTLIDENNTPDNFEVAFLVCKHFVPNRRGLKKYKHLDGNKDNNSASNLMWDRVGDAQPSVYRSRATIKPRRGRIEGHGGIRSKHEVYCLETDTVYSSTGAAAIDLMLNQSGLSNVLRSGKDRYCGYHVCYGEEKDTHVWTKRFAVRVTIMETNEVLEFRSINSAVNELGINRRTVVRHLESGAPVKGMIFDVVEK